MAEVRGVLESLGAQSIKDSSGGLNVVVDPGVFRFLEEQVRVVFNSSPLLFPFLLRRILHHEDDVTSAQPRSIPLSCRPVLLLNIYTSAKYYSPTRLCY